MCLECKQALLSKHQFRDNKKLKQGHFEMGIRCANFTPISNRCARRRATLCPLAKCYQERHLTYIVGVWKKVLCRSRAYGEWQISF